MRTTRSEVTFERPFILNMDVGELPAGTYQIDTDEEEILAPDRTAYRRTAVYFYVSNGASTRMLVIDPHDLDSALGRDSQASAGATG
jgi:hypothetical protein